MSMKFKPGGCLIHYYFLDPGRIFPLMVRSDLRKT